MPSEITATTIKHLFTEYHPAVAPAIIGIACTLIGHFTTDHTTFYSSLLAGGFNYAFSIGATYFLLKGKRKEIAKIVSLLALTILLGEFAAASTSLHLPTPLTYALTTCSLLLAAKTVHELTKDLQGKSYYTRHLTAVAALILALTYPLFFQTKDSIAISAISFTGAALLGGLFIHLNDHRKEKNTYRIISLLACALILGEVAGFAGEGALSNLTLTSASTLLSGGAVYLATKEKRIAWIVASLLIGEVALFGQTAFHFGNDGTMTTGILAAAPLLLGTLHIIESHFRKRAELRELLSDAVYYNKPRIVQYLVTENPWLITWRDANGNTLLHHVALKNWGKLIPFLLQHREGHPPLTNALTNNYGTKPSHMTRDPFLECRLELTAPQDIPATQPFMNPIMGRGSWRHIEQASDALQPLNEALGSITTAHEEFMRSL